MVAVPTALIEMLKDTCVDPAGTVTVAGNTLAIAGSEDCTVNCAPPAGAGDCNTNVAATACADPAANGSGEMRADLTKLVCKVPDPPVAWLKNASSGARYPSNCAMCVGSAEIGRAA